MKSCLSNLCSLSACSDIKTPPKTPQPVVTSLHLLVQGPPDPQGLGLAPFPEWDPCGKSSSSHLLKQTPDPPALAARLLLCTAPRAQHWEGVEPHKIHLHTSLGLKQLHSNPLPVGFCVVLHPFFFPRASPHLPWIFHQHPPAHQACEHSREIAPCSSLISYPWSEL